MFRPNEFVEGFAYARPMQQPVEIDRISAFTADAAAPDVIVDVDKEAVVTFPATGTGSDHVVALLAQMPATCGQKRDDRNPFGAHNPVIVHDELNSDGESEDAKPAPIGGRHQEGN